MNEELKEAETNDKGKSSKFSILLIAKIILVVVVCLCVFFVAYGSTRNVDDSSAFVFIGIGIAFAAVAIGIAIFIFVIESKFTKK